MFYKNLAPVYRFVFPVGNKANFLKEHLPGSGNILDVGSADGTIMSAFKALVPDLNLVGIDLSEALIEEATKLFPSLSEQFSLRDMRNAKAAFGLSYFDGIYCIGNTIVHLEHIDDVLSDFNDMLKPGGTFILQILNYDKILAERPSKLPLIDNEQITFERFYSYEEGKMMAVPRITFSSLLTIKSEMPMKLSAETILYPIKIKNLLEKLDLAGFENHQLYSGFDGKSFSDNELPLIVVTQKGV
jgi:2-polyprenyl-3-methyl-5-hydroxy-6-metoxy-1,4-benzoquinol methylase